MTNTDELLDPRIERTRAAAIEAAVELLNAKGIDGITHRTVAESARVSRTTVYRHWPTRADLLRATFETMVGPKHKEPTGHLRQDLIRFVDELAEHLRDVDQAKMFASIIERSQWDPVVAEVKRLMCSDGYDHLAAILENGLRDGEVRADLDLEIATDQLVGTVFTRCLISDRPIDTNFLERLIDEFLAVNSRG